jgi:hypothetical protein
MVYECNICNNNFKTIYSLNKHKNNAKYCKNISNNKTYCLCNYCNKENIENLEIHLNICVEYLKLQIKTIKNENKELEIYKYNYDLIKKENEEYKFQISKLEQQNKELLDKLNDITIKLIEKPNNNNITTNNNYSNNKNNTTNNTKIDIFNTLTPLKDSDFFDSAGKLTFDHVKRGVEGYVDYSMEYPLKDKLLCVDYGRKKICYKDENENKVEEYKFDSILPKIFSGINEANNELINTVIDEVDDEFNSKLRVYEPFDEGSKEDKEYSKLQDDNFDIKMKYANMLFDSRNIVKGNLNNKLAKEMSEMLINKIPKK